MGGIFGGGGGGSVKPPPPTPPSALPEVGAEVGERARRKAPRGRRVTFLTGDLVPEDKEKKKFLG